MQRQDRNYNQRGQGLVEFALVIPVLLLIVLGGIYLGNVMRQVNAMNNAADGGVFYASLGHDASEVEAFVKLRLREEHVDPEAVEINIIPASYTYGDVVTVGITKTMGVPALIYDTTFPISVRASEIIQKEVRTTP